MPAGNAPTGGLTLDLANDELVVGNQRQHRRRLQPDRKRQYSRDCARLGGAATGIGRGPIGLGVDPASDELFVSQPAGCDAIRHRVPPDRQRQHRASSAP